VGAEVRSCLETAADHVGRSRTGKKKKKKRGGEEKGISPLLMFLDKAIDQAKSTSKARYPASFIAEATSVEEKGGKEGKKKRP